ncbi:MAG TPA: CoA transferase [Dehalococcoidia bacterium]|nr:CoA transferase [Dehalococcoidia bacterium]
MASGPFVGIRILEFSQIIAGPLGCMLLADMGAEVIKVEPVAGEPWRLTAQFVPLESKTYQALNRGKQSLAMDLTQQQSQDAIHRLVADIDVVVINYRPDVAARLGIDYETLKAIKPDLIYVDSTAFGRKGPLAQRPGYDIVIQSFSGLTAAGGRFDENGNPTLPGGQPTADNQTGYAIAWGVSAALFHRERTGRGQLVETSLLANALMVQYGSFMSLPAGDAMVRGALLKQLEQAQGSGKSYRDFVEERREMMRRRGAGGVYYRCFNTKNGAIAVGCLSVSLREKMRQALDFTDIRDEPDYDPLAPESQAFQQELTAKIEEMIEGDDSEHWIDVLEGAGVPVSAIEFVETLDQHEQVIENGYVIDLDHDITGPQTQVAPPIKMSDSPPQAQGASPPLGRDNDAILASAGYSSDEITAMRDAGAIR